MSDEKAAEFREFVDRYYSGCSLAADWPLIYEIYTAALTKSDE
jgi:hypothetical protein